MNGNLTPAEEAIQAVDPWRRGDLHRDLIDAAVYISTHPRVPVPDQVIARIPVHGDGPDERVHDVLMTAVELGVCAVEVDGWLCASRQFGPVTLEARTPARPHRKAA